MRPYAHDPSGDRWYPCPRGTQWRGDADAGHRRWLLPHRPRRRLRVPAPAGCTDGHGSRHGGVRVGVLDPRPFWLLQHFGYLSIEMHTHSMSILVHSIIRLDRDLPPPPSPLGHLPIRLYNKYALFTPMHACRLAGEEALRHNGSVAGPGSLRVGLIDRLHLMDRDTVLQGIRIQVGKLP